MTPAPVRAAIGLGGNLGPVADTLRDAVSAIGDLPGTRVAGVSRLYRSPAWGPVAQPDYLNAACLVDTRRPPVALLEDLLAIERRFGRDRESPGSQRWGPRTLDLDLLVFGARRVQTPGLSVPHPRLHERAFVLLPLAELDPGLEIPGRGRVDALLAGLDVHGVEALP